MGIFFEADFEGSGGRQEKCSERVKHRREQSSRAWGELGNFSGGVELGELENEESRQNPAAEGGSEEEVSLVSLAADRVLAAGSAEGRGEKILGGEEQEDENLESEDFGRGDAAGQGARDGGDGQNFGEQQHEGCGEVETQNPARSAGGASSSEKNQQRERNQRGSQNSE